MNNDDLLRSNKLSLFDKLTRRRIEQYRQHLRDLDLSEATTNRRLSTLRRFCAWAEKEGYLEENPFVTPIPVRRFIPISYRKFKFPTLLTIPTLPTLSRIYQIYQSISITKYLHYAILIIFCASLGFGAYDQFFRKVPEPLAYPPASAPVTPNRYLSFQGRLTDSSDNPISSSTSFRFALYNDATASDSAQLWEEQRAITPDQDGIFSVILGTNVAIPTTVFTDNASIWLGVTVNQDPGMTPRQQIATVGYALNAETLQGIPPSASPSANKIPIITQSGDLVLAGASPRVYSTSGTFGIKGQALSITTDTGTNGNITIAPDGTGKLNINLGGASGNQIRVTDANITSGSLVSAYAGTNSTGFDLLNLSSGDPETEKFAVDYSGDASLAGGDITGANSVILDIGENSSSYVTSSVGFAVGGGTTYYFASTGNLNANTGTFAGDFSQTGATTFSTGTGLVSINGNLATSLIPNSTSYNLGSASNYWGAIYANNYYSPGTGVSGYWQRNLGTLSPTNITDDVLVGGTATSSALVRLPGINNQNAWFNLGTGNVGIGTTGPNSKLEVAGDIALGTNYLKWGTSGSEDTTLYRSSASALALGTDNDLVAQNTAGDVVRLQTGANASYLLATETASGDWILAGGVSGDTQQRFTISAGGGHSWGEGGATAVDTNLYRSAANILKTDDSLYIATNLGVGYDPSTITNGVAAFNGNVGIGTTGPGTSLQIGTSKAFNVYLSLGGSINPRYYLLGTVNDNNGEFLISGILAGHSQAIGKASVNIKFSVRDGFLALGNVWGTVGSAGDILVYDDAANNKYRIYLKADDWALVNLDLTAASGATISYDGTYTETDPAGSYSLQFTLSSDAGQIVRSLNNGNVGIGTTSPTALLDISGATGATTSGILTFRGTTDPSINVLNGENLTFKTSVGGDTGLTTKMTLSNAGGLTLVGDLRLNNNQILNSAGTAAIIFSATPSTSYNTLDAGNWLVSNTANLGQAALMINQTMGGDIFTASASGTPKFVISNAGRVGIGTTSPETQLHLTGNLRVEGGYIDSTSTSFYGLDKLWTTTADFNAAGTTFSSGMLSPATNNELKLNAP